MKRTLLLLVIALGFADNSFAQLKGKKTNPVVRGVAPENAPNVIIDVSTPLIDAVMRRPIDRNDPIDEIIQDSPVTGMGRTIGFVTAEVIPDAKRAVVELVFRGQVLGETTAARAMIQADATAVTDLEVRRRLVIDGSGIQSIPGANFGRTNISLIQIKPRMELAGMTTRVLGEGLMVRVATEKFRSSRGDAEFETSTKAAWNTSRKMNAELKPALADISKAAMEGNAGFKRAGLATRDLSFSSNSSGVQARLRFDTLAKDIKSSPASSKGVDLGLRVHQSVINEAARANIGGKSFSLDQMQKFYEDFTQGIVRDGRSAKDQKDGAQNLKMLLALAGPSVTFAEKNPLTIVFTEQGFAFEIDIASMPHDKKVYEGMRVRAEYRIEHAKEGIVFVRQGGIKFLPPTTTGKKLDPLPFAFTVVRDMLFAELMKERLVVPSLPLPEPMRNVRLHSPRAGARDGWFALAWTLAP